MDVIADMATSGSLDHADDVTEQFADHFEKVTQGSSGPKWVARFVKAYVAHVLMGIRASIDFSRSETGNVVSTWPAKRTVLVRADQGISVQAFAEGSSKYFDLEKYVPDVDLYELPGTHFGILNPKSGLAEVLNMVLKQ